MTNGEGKGVKYLKKEDIYKWRRRKTERVKRGKYLENENFSFRVGGIYLEKENILF